MALNVNRSRLHRLHASASLDAVAAHVLKGKGQRRDWVGALLRHIELTARGEHLKVTRADDVSDHVQIVGVQRGLDRVIIKRLAWHKVKEQANLGTPDCGWPRLAATKVEPAFVESHGAWPAFGTRPHILVKALNIPVASRPCRGIKKRVFNNTFHHGVADELSDSYPTLW